MRFAAFVLTVLFASPSYGSQIGFIPQLDNHVSQTIVGFTFDGHRVTTSYLEGLVGKDVESFQNCTASLDRGVDCVAVRVANGDYAATIYTITNESCSAGSCFGGYRTYAMSELEFLGSNQFEVKLYTSTPTNRISLIASLRTKSNSLALGATLKIGIASDEDGAMTQAIIDVYDSQGGFLTETAVWAGEPQPISGSSDGWTACDIQKEAATLELGNMDMIGASMSGVLGLLGALLTVPAPPASAALYASSAVAGLATMWMHKSLSEDIDTRYQQCTTLLELGIQPVEPTQVEEDEAESVSNSALSALMAATDGGGDVDGECEDGEVMAVDAGPLDGYADCGHYYECEGGEWVYQYTVCGDKATP